MLNREKPLQHPSRRKEKIQGHLFDREIHQFGHTVCQYNYTVRSHRRADVLPRALLPPHPVGLTVPAIPP